MQAVPSTTDQNKVHSMLLGFSDEMSEPTSAGHKSHRHKLAPDVSSGYASCPTNHKCLQDLRASHSQTTKTTNTVSGPCYFSWQAPIRRRRAKPSHSAIAWNGARFRTSCLGFSIGEAGHNRVLKNDDVPSVSP